MGFLNKLKSVNNSWGYVTYLSDGSLGRIFGRIGPKNMIDNRSQELMITSGTMNGPLKEDIVFSAKDVRRATVLQATNEWVKYRLELNSGLVAIVVMTVMGLDVKARGNKATMDRNFSDKWLNFEAWLGEALFRGCNQNGDHATSFNGFLNENKSNQVNDASNETVSVQPDNSQEVPIEASRRASSSSVGDQNSMSHQSADSLKPRNELGDCGVSVGSLKIPRKNSWMCDCGYSNSDSSLECINCFKKRK